jgi:hypothetical protein
MDTCSGNTVFVTELDGFSKTVTEKVEEILKHGSAENPYYTNILHHPKRRKRDLVTDATM